ncbi:unnamed protein product [Mytilus coruscus]|uniref:Uncharacterized protein n=1 Tax=Mytilus coruscus TaxID=42192 RepID=A0A6J8E851_MYTCO|nr:unnamed protein product [Mytilus coruscus]
MYSTTSIILRATIISSTVWIYLMAFPFFIQAYQLDCPSYPHWKIRGKGLCNSSVKYTCLLNTNENKYNENCEFGLRFLGAGYKFVISGKLDRRHCISERFQSVTMLSNMSSSCVTLKSKCNEEGQIVFSDGTTTEDRSCRCNYIKNFAFVTKPKGTCYCIPSKEDCNCYYKTCPVDHYLTPVMNVNYGEGLHTDNYHCVHFSELAGIFQCPEIQKEKKPRCVEKANEMFITQSTQDSTCSTSSMNILVIHVVCMILVILFCVGKFFS